MRWAILRRELDSQSEAELSSLQHSARTPVRSAAVASLLPAIAFAIVNGVSGRDLASILIRSALGWAGLTVFFAISLALLGRYLARRCTRS